MEKVRHPAIPNLVLYNPSPELKARLEEIHSEMVERARAETKKLIDRLIAGSRPK